MENIIFFSYSLDHFVFKSLSNIYFSWKSLILKGFFNDLSADLNEKIHGYFPGVYPQKVSVLECFLARKRSKE